MNNIVKLLKDFYKDEQIPQSVRNREDGAYELHVYNYENEEYVENKTSEYDFLINGSYKIEIAFRNFYPGVNIEEYMFYVNNIKFITHDYLKTYFVGCKVDKAQCLYPYLGWSYSRFWNFIVINGKVEKAKFIYESPSSGESFAYDMLYSCFTDPNI